jgi:hypothetical protein
MIVTDYRITDHRDILEEGKADEWKRLVAEGGFDALAAMDQAEEVAFGYPKASNMVVNALKFLLPAESTVEKYKHDIPPIEALGLISYAKMTGDFEKITIRFHDKMPDPVALGFKGNEVYLIAAWGPDSMKEDEIMEKFNLEYVRAFPLAKEKAMRELEREECGERMDQYLRSGYNYGNLTVTR